MQEDVFLFNALFQDLFPNIDLPDEINEPLAETIQAEMIKDGLVP